MNWTWETLDDNGCFVQVPDELAGEVKFHTQADAETWIGENWQGLHEAGVAAVTLTESGKRIYGPMNLEAG